ncbi:DUF4870 domain-containing protein [Rariglobus hedericola]|uniref:DUF4870 domain-containing protein n=1 Tax=Rariglobus hedericola TaxID=2597822 RepID=A0A556QR36_9BACT|nr:hypothetical protein [Rariglobus hedericola]TSJ79107.1 hypothetical protein FPL22_07390 [Rariglobus hedericola]
MSNSPFTVTPETAVVQEDRTVAILSYITIIGFIVAIVMHNGKKTALGAFHLRQVLGLIVAGFAVWIGLMIIAFIPLIQLLNVVLIPVVGIGFLVFALIGLIAAASGQQKPVPVIGEHFQKWFAGTFV